MKFNLPSLFIAFQLVLSSKKVVAQNSTTVLLGPLAEREHAVAGDVYLISDRVLEIRNFAYDGTFKAS